MPQPVVPVFSCVVCHEPAAPTPRLCSLPCALEASAELRRNVVDFHRLRRIGAPESDLRRVTERNGQLSASLMRWRSPARSDAEASSV